MAVTPSNMLPLGTKAPAFSLPDTVSGRVLGLADLGAKSGTVVMFLCNHCPFVKHLVPSLPQLACEFMARGIAFVGISSNDVKEYPEDSPEKMKFFARASGFGFPYLYDETQEVAKAYQAACTPDFYVFNSGLELVYRGRFDASRPGSEVKITGADLRAALEALLAGRLPSQEQYPSVGCNIKWKT